MMRKIINKVLRREESVRMCPSCDKIINQDKEKCPRCGYSFETVTSTPEDGL